MSNDSDNDYDDGLMLGLRNEPRIPGIDRHLPKSFRDVLEEHIRFDLESFENYRDSTRVWGNKIYNAYKKREYLYHYMKTKSQEQGVDIQLIAQELDTIHGLKTALEIQQLPIDQRKRRGNKNTMTKVLRLLYRRDGGIKRRVKTTILDDLQPTEAMIEDERRMREVLDQLDQDEFDRDEQLQVEQQQRNNETGQTRTETTEIIGGRGLTTARYAGLAQRTYQNQRNNIDASRNLKLDGCHRPVRIIHTNHLADGSCCCHDNFF